MVRVQMWDVDCEGYFSTNLFRVGASRICSFGALVHLAPQPKYKSSKVIYLQYSGLSGLVHLVKM